MTASSRAEGRFLLAYGAVGSNNDMQRLAAATPTENLPPSHRRYLLPLLWSVVVGAVVLAGVAIGTQRKESAPSTPANLRSSFGDINMASTALTVDNGYIRSDKLDIPLGRGYARYTVALASQDPDPSPPPVNCDAALILSVGTAMTTGQYDSLAVAIARLGYPVVVVDPAPGFVVKIFGPMFARTVSAAKPALNKKLNCKVKTWVVGGHSAGGWAAHEAVVEDPSLADAVFSLDPFYFEKAGGLFGGLKKPCPKPAAYWGFSNTTCTVSVDEAARGFYRKTAYGGEGSKQHRVLYLVDNDTPKCTLKKRVDQGDDSASADKQRDRCSYGHCSFATTGDCQLCNFDQCAIKMGTCPTEPPPDFYTDVANTFDRFVRAVNGSLSWDDIDLVPPGGTETKLYGVWVDQDM